MFPHKIQAYYLIGGIFFEDYSRFIIVTFTSLILRLCFYNRSKWSAVLGYKSDVSRKHVSSPRYKELISQVKVKQKSK